MGLDDVGWGFVRSQDEVHLLEFDQVIGNTLKMAGGGKSLGQNDPKIFVFRNDSYATNSHTLEFPIR
jgi:hypothetical protein